MDSEDNVDFKWYDKYHVFKEKELHESLQKQEYEEFKRLLSKIYLSREAVKKYIVVSNKENELFAVVGKLVESFSKGK